MPLCAFISISNVFENVDNFSIEGQCFTYIFFCNIPNSLIVNKLFFPFLIASNKISVIFVYILFPTASRLKH